MRNRLFAVCTGAAALVLFGLSPALAARASSSTVPPALQPALYAAMAKDTGPAEAIGRDGCATLKTQRLTACFGKDGARFSGKNAPTVTLRLADYGRDNHLTTVEPVTPMLQGNRASYAHGNITEWWRVLPVGFEQGFTLAKRPAGAGDLTLQLATNRKATTHGEDLAFGKLGYGTLVVTDSKGHVVSAKLTSEGDLILIAVNDAQATYPLTVDPLVWVEQKVTASDGAAGDWFGQSVAVSGAVALVGAYGATIDGNTREGAAYVFTKSGGVWSQTQKLTASDGKAEDHFGWSVALDGNTAFVGSPRATGLHAHQGAAYVFTESGGVWSQSQKLIVTSDYWQAACGSAVALDGSTAVIGAEYDDADQQGAAYVFTNSDGTWTQVQKLTADYPVNWGYFGYSAAISGTTIVVGEPEPVTLYDEGPGAAYVFTESGGTWTQAQKLTSGDNELGAEFGDRVALSGTTVLVGEPFGGDVGDLTGAAFVFTESGGTWNLAQKLTANDGADGDGFGWAVGFVGAAAAVGAPEASIGGNQHQGAVYLFSNAGGTWTQTAKLTASDGAAGDTFGSSVAFVDTGALVGAPFATVGGHTAQGAAYVYTATCPQGYGEHDGMLNAGGLYGSPSYQAPAGLENGILGGPDGFRLYLQYSNGSSSHVYRIPGNEIHKLGPAGTYRWGVKAGNTGGNYVLCVLHP